MPLTGAMKEWVAKLKAYQDKHHVSYKAAMSALKGSGSKGRRKSHRGGSSDGVAAHAEAFTPQGDTSPQAPPPASATPPMAAEHAAAAAAAAAPKELAGFEVKALPQSGGSGLGMFEVGAAPQNGGRRRHRRSSSSRRGRRGSRGSRRSSRRTQQQQKQQRRSRSRRGGGSGSSLSYSDYA